MNVLFPIFERVSLELWQRFDIWLPPGAVALLAFFYSLGATYLLLRLLGLWGDSSR
jgi:hypothetical protein